MFRHLKPEELVHLIEGGPLPPAKATHLESCARCREAWAALAPLYSRVSALDDDIPEPDWAEFRNGVRDEMLSRSVQRQMAVQRWMGWRVRPAAVLACLLLLVLGGTTGVFMWKGQSSTEPSVTQGVIAPGAERASATEFPGFDAEMATWSTKNVYEELGTLEDDEEDVLRGILENEGIRGFDQRGLEQQ